ncbi:MAG: hypothetical protein ACOC23_09735, partial [Thermodesulfobacteriota bacterium]
MTDAAAIIEKKILDGEGHFTRTEAAAITGLSLDAARDALEILLEKYVCRLQVTENGDLIYDFGKRPRRRGRKTPGEILKAAGEWLWQAFTVLFKIWIALVLAVYFVVFVVILFAVLIAAVFGKQGDRGGELIGKTFSRMGRSFLAIFHWKTITGDIDYSTDSLGYRFRKFKSKSALLNQEKKGFIASVYDFVFGPPRVDIDPLNNEKEVAAYLRQQRGILTIAELMALAGWTLSEAQAFFTDCLVRFQGEVEVTEEEGVIYGEFDQVLRGVGEAEGGKVIWYWDEYEPVHEWTGNSAGRNLLIAGMNGFNLVFATVVLFQYPVVLRALGADTVSRDAVFGLVAALGWMPLVFSLIFFLVPLLRYPAILRNNRRRHEANIRKRLYRAIFSFQGRPMTIDQAAAAVNRNAPEEQLGKETVARWLHTLVLDLGGETEVSDAGEVVYSFP